MSNFGKAPLFLPELLKKNPQSRIVITGHSLGGAAATLEVARRVLGSENVVLSSVPFMSSEDLGNYFLKVPGALIWLGVAADGEDYPGLHSPYFRLNPEALIYGVAIHINNVLNFLN